MIETAEKDGVLFFAVFYFPSEGSFQLGRRKSRGQRAGFPLFIIHMKDGCFVPFGMLGVVFRANTLNEKVPSTLDTESGNSKKVGGSK